jgi:hypothetical protein
MRDILAAKVQGGEGYQGVLEQVGGHFAGAGCFLIKDASSASLSTRKTGSQNVTPSGKLTINQVLPVTVSSRKC